MKMKVAFIIFAALFLTACSRTITSDQYINAMAALGCANLSETSPEAGAVLKTQGVTQGDINVYRKKMDPKKVMEIVNSIASRVIACHSAKP